MTILDPAGVRPSRTRHEQLAALRGHLRDPLYRNAYALMASTAVTGAVGVLFWAVAARRFSGKQVGENAALISAMMTISTFAQLDLAAMLLRFLPQWRANARWAVIRCYLVSSAAALIASGGFVLVAAHLRDNMAFLHDKRLAIAFCIAVVTWGIFAIQDGVLTGLGRTTVVPIENSAFGVAKLGLLMVLTAGVSQWGIFLAWVVPVVVSLVPINLLIFRRYLPHHERRPPHPEPLDRRLILRYIGFDYMGALCGAATTMAMPLLVIATLGAGASAHFYVAWTLVLIVDTVGLSLGSSLLVEGSYDPAMLVANARRLVRRGLLLIVPTIAAVIVLAPLLLNIFGHGYSAASTGSLRILVLGIIPRSVIILYAAVARVQGDVRRVLAVVVVVTVLTISLVVLGARHFGLAGVAGGWVLGYSLAAVAVLPGLRRALDPAVLR